VSLMDKFINKKKKSNDDEFEDFDNEDAENELDDESVDDDQFDNNEFDSDFDEDDIEGGESEFKQQTGNLKDLIQQNKKAAIGVGSIAGLAVAGVIVEPYITKMMNSGDVMDNNEFEKTQSQVQQLASSSVKEDKAFATAKKVERAAKLEKLKELREKKEQIKTSSKLLNTKGSLDKKREPKTVLIKKNIVLPTINETTATIINTKGHIDQKKATTKMASNFNKIQVKVESTELMHNPTDKMDPFLQEYDGTVNSRAMRSELTENMKLMKDYIEFLDTKKQFEQAKLIYEKKKQKGLFADEINSVKKDFLAELEGMKSSMAELRTLNAKMANRLLSEKEDKAMSEIKKANDELASRKMRLNNNGTQKVYKIGSNYMLEENDGQGNTKIFKNGNAYKGSIITQITPEFIKVKESNGEVIILSINTGSEMTGTYATIKIPTPAKSGVENNDIEEGVGLKVEEYSYAKAKEKASSTQASEQSIKSRFLK